MEESKKKEKNDKEMEEDMSDSGGQKNVSIVGSEPIAVGSPVMLRTTPNGDMLSNLEGAQKTTESGLSAGWKLLAMLMFILAVCYQKGFLVWQTATEPVVSPLAQSDNLMTQKLIS